jgi:hypothetical protein
VTFYIKGNGEAHLTGYYDPMPESDEESEEEEKV